MKWNVKMVDLKSLILIVSVSQLVEGLESNVKSANGLFATHRLIEQIKRTLIVNLDIHDPDRDKELLSKFQNVDAEIMSIDTNFNSIDALIEYICAEDESIINPWQKTKNARDQIGLFYGRFQSYIHNRAYYDDTVLDDFAHAHHAEEHLNLLHKQIVPQKRSDSFLYKLYRTSWLQDGKQLCSLGQSPHQVMYNLYNVIALTEIKGYAMIQFSYMIMRLYDQGNFTVETELARKSFESQATKKLLAMKAILPHMSRTYFKCDPNEHIEGETFVRMTNLLQGHIENEIDLNNQQSCTKTCEPYNFAEPKSCYKDLFCAKQPACKGRLFDCGFYDADAWVCMSGQKDRKYEWIEYEDGTRLGRKEECANQIKVDSWWRWIFWHCSYCFCKCDAPGPDSDRYWSLQPALADIDSNKVITGVKFVKKNRIIQIEIQQSSALPEGVVNETERTWIESPNDLHFDDGENVFEMSYESRALDLDTLEAPPGHVITGLKFRKLGSHINLEARITPISFKEGKLDADKSTWIGSDQTQASESDKRTRVSIISPDVPTRYLSKNIMDSRQNQFVLFDATSADKDVAQTTIPYIDAQEVAPTSGVWISGVGLYHKGSIGYGGFVGFLVKTLDFSAHILPDMKANVNSKTARLVMREELKYDFSVLR